MLKAWLFCGSYLDGERAAILYTLIQSAKLNDVDPQVLLASMLARMHYPPSRLDELHPWNWMQRRAALAA